MYLYTKSVKKSIGLALMTVCVCVCVCVVCAHACCRCEDMVDVRRLKMLQMVQLFKCEEDALQVQNNKTHTHILTQQKLSVLMRC